MPFTYHQADKQNNAWCRMYSMKQHDKNSASKTSRITFSEEPFPFVTFLDQSSCNWNMQSRHHYRKKGCFSKYNSDLEIRSLQVHHWLTVWEWILPQTHLGLIFPHYVAKQSFPIISHQHSPSSYPHCKTSSHASPCSPTSSLLLSLGAGKLRCPIIPSYESLYPWEMSALQLVFHWLHQLGNKIQ